MGGSVADQLSAKGSVSVPEVLGAGISAGLLEGIVPEKTAKAIPGAVQVGARVARGTMGNIAGDFLGTMIDHAPTAVQQFVGSVMNSWDQGNEQLNSGNAPWTPDRDPK